LENIPKSQSSWVIECFQRNQISQGLIKCNPDDVILISDLDEIPNPDAIRNYIPGSGIHKLVQSLYYYYLNYRCAAINNKWILWRKATKWIPWESARICQFKDIKSDIETIRTGWQYNIRCPQIMNGGWHFAYTGGIEKIVEKIESFSHQEYNNSYFKDKSRLIKSIEENKDLYNRKYKYIQVPIDEHYPKYIQDNIPLLKEKGLIL
jgi:beta-1,4-mannosyl-glycoprotein beta-1,4-N-acetylglucosaminyltransferase